MNKSVEWFAKQLQSEDNYKRFNSFNKNLYNYEINIRWVLVEDIEAFQGETNKTKIMFIHTCLSKIDDKAVIENLDGINNNIIYNIIYNIIKIANDTGLKINYDSLCAGMSEDGYEYNLKNAVDYITDILTDENKHSVVETCYIIYKLSPKTISEVLYLAFDEPLREGKSLNEALTALDKKMVELKIIDSF